MLYYSYASKIEFFSIETNEKYFFNKMKTIDRSLEILFCILKSLKQRNPRKNWISPKATIFCVIEILIESSALITKNRVERFTTCD